MSENYTVLVDTREQQPHSFHDEERCTATISATLETGDYTLRGLRDKLCIERKGSVSELASNITQKRFYNELERMKSYKYRYIICEFFLGDILRYPIGSGIPKFKLKYIKVTPNFILSSIHRISNEYGVNVVFCGDRGSAHKFMISLFNFTSKEIDRGGNEQSEN